MHQPEDGDNIREIGDEVDCNHLLITTAREVHLCTRKREFCGLASAFTPIGKGTIRFQVFGGGEEHSSMAPFSISRLSFIRTSYIRVPSFFLNGAGEFDSELQYLVGAPRGNSGKRLVHGG